MHPSRHIYISTSLSPTLQQVILLLRYLSNTSHTHSLVPLGFRHRDMYSSNRKTNVRHPILAQMISTFPPLFRLLPLLIFSTLYSTATSTDSATFADLTMPISPPCPLSHNTSLNKYLSWYTAIFKNHEISAPMDSGPHHRIAEK